MQVGVSLQDVCSYMHNSSSTTIDATKWCGTWKHLTFCLFKQLLVDWFTEVLQWTLTKEIC